MNVISKNIQLEEMQFKAQIREFINECFQNAANLPLQITAMSGGISSELRRVSFNNQDYCIKRSLKQLRVTAISEVPVERNLNEFNYLNYLKNYMPNNLPQPIAYSTKHQMFIMQYFKEPKFLNWKLQLKNGILNEAIPRKLGNIVGKIHQFTYHNKAALSQRFASENIFFHIRLKPYFLSLMAKHPHLTGYIASVIHLMFSHKFVLVHGDISPKNILVSKKAIILLDPECAWYGDPAFELAFLLNHILLKCLLLPLQTKNLLHFFAIIFEQYTPYIIWEDKNNFNYRLARILPILILARIDGDYPVEYIQENFIKNKIRKFCFNIMTMNFKTPLEIMDLWPKFLLEL
jgi:tRNA A-37 threonylcarbamoyl transferase component Bud32